MLLQWTVLLNLVQSVLQFSGGSINSILIDSILRKFMKKILNNPCSILCLGKKSYCPNLCLYQM